MKRKNIIAFLLGTALLMGLAACGSDTEEGSVTPDPTSSQEVSESPSDSLEEETALLTLEASFVDSVGQPLAGTTVRISTENGDLDYVTGDDGTLTIPDIPRNESVQLILFQAADDSTEAEDGSTEADVEDGTTVSQDVSTASLVEVGRLELMVEDGTLTDVAQQDGPATITAPEDTESVAVTFTLGDDAAITCTLDLAEEG